MIGIPDTKDIVKTLDRHTAALNQLAAAMTRHAAAQEQANEIARGDAA